MNVTIHDLKDRARLAKTLADAGIPVVLTSGRVCESDDKQVPSVTRVARKLPGPYGDAFFSINRKAMPPGTELVIGIGLLRQGAHREIAAAFGLTKKGVPLNCPGK